MMKNHRQAGFTLVELMVALIIGLIVIGAAGSMFLSNRRVYTSTETVGRIQENQRSSFELMTRDIRETAGSPCNAYNTPVNMLKNASGSAFWTQFGNGLFGMSGAAGASDSLDLYMTNEGDIAITLHDNPSADLNVTTNSGVALNDMLMACNADVSIIFQVTMTPTGNKIQHNGGAGGNNCSQEFQWKTPDPKCAGASSSWGYCFVPGTNPGPGCSRSGKGPATVVRLSAIRWEVKDNGRGGKSLYRSVYHIDQNGLLATAASTAEVAEGVQALRLKYAVKGSTNFVDASTITAASTWKQVTAVQMVLTMSGAAGAQQGQDLNGTNNNLLTRTLTNTVALRNREGLL